MNDQAEIQRFKTAFRRGVIAFFDPEEQLLIAANLDHYRRWYSRYKSLCGVIVLASCACVAGLTWALLNGGPHLAIASASGFLLLERWALPWMRAKKRRACERGTAFLRRLTRTMIQRVEEHRGALDRDIQEMLDIASANLREHGETTEK